MMISRDVLIVSFVLISLLSLVLHVALNSPISPLPLSLPSSLLVPNNLLQRVDKLGEGKLVGPEDVWVGQEGEVFTATRDGWIKSIKPGGLVEEWRFVGGPAVLGIAGSKDGSLQGRNYQWAGPGYSPSQVFSFLGLRLH